MVSRLLRCKAQPKLPQASLERFDLARLALLDVFQADDFCLGNALARQMLRSVLTELYTRIPDITVTGEPDFQVNNFIHGVHALPVRWTPTKL